MKHVRGVATVLMAAYLLTVAWVVFWPSAGPATASATWMSDVLGFLGAPDWLSSTIVEFLANIALFLPLSFLGSLLVPSWSWRRWLLTGFCASAFIELGQLAVLPDRSATVVDLVANTLGALVGAMLVLPVLARLIPDDAAGESPMLREDTI